jgi:hypothetical protein
LFVTDYSPVGILTSMREATGVERLGETYERYCNKKLHSMTFSCRLHVNSYRKAMNGICLNRDICHTERY